MCTCIGFLVGRSKYGEQIVLESPINLQHIRLQNGIGTGAGNVSRVEKIVTEKMPTEPPVTEPPKVCNIHDTQEPTQDRHECVRTKWSPTFYICIHPINKDIYVSKSIKVVGIWEKHVLRVFQGLLQKDKEYGVIDIGANLGKIWTYSVLVLL